MNIPRGFKDNIGKETTQREAAKDTLRTIFKSYGYQGLETPIVETKDVLTFKGGDEIQEEIYQFQDRGGQELGLRFDQTVPFARYIAEHHKQISFPFRRYEIGPVFRDGPVQVGQGRYKSFTQCDVDIAGITSMVADAEILSIAGDVFDKLSLGAVDITINNRKVLDGILEANNVEEKYMTTIISILDKMDRFGPEGVLNLLQRQEDFNEEKKQMERILTDEQAYRIIEHTTPEQDNQATIRKLESIITSAQGQAGITEVRELLNYADNHSIKVMPALARGLNYYTGTTFEVFLKDKSIIASAITAGGRYDQMIGDYIGNQEHIPAVGISFGLERLCQALGTTNEPTANIYLIPVSKKDQATTIAYATSLREQGLQVITGINEGRMKTAMKDANRKDIPYVGIIGEEETRANNITLKDMKKGTQETIPFKDTKAYLQRE